ncbi:MAG: hypothetical protein RR585_09735 [Coprobacillus sp.]
MLIRHIYILKLKIRPKIWIEIFDEIGISDKNFLVKPVNGKWQKKLFDVYEKNITT